VFLPDPCSGGKENDAGEIRLIFGKIRRGWGLKRRAYVDIVRDVLLTCMEGETRTEVRRGCSIDTAKMGHYVVDLLREGLLEERRVKVLRWKVNSNSRKPYAVRRRMLFTTERGRDYLEAYKRLTAFLKAIPEVGRPEPLRRPSEVEEPQRAADLL